MDRTGIWSLSLSSIQSCVPFKKKKKFTYAEHLLCQEPELQQQIKHGLFLEELMVWGKIDTEISYFNSIGD